MQKNADIREIIFPVLKKHDEKIEAQKKRRLKLKAVREMKQKI
jgi:hypothetical protein